jgi:hypothetical protein
MLLLQNGSFRTAIGGGRITTTADVRGTIFYDYNNTGYYVDPNSGTNTYGRFQQNGAHGDSQIGVRLLAGNNGAGTGEINLRMWCSEPGVTWDWAGFGYNVTNDGGSPSGFGRLNGSHGQGYFRFSTGGNVYMYNTNTGGSRSTTMEWYSDSTVYANNYLTGGNSLRAPIFYDTNNTAYYTDPTGYSQMSSGEFNSYCRARLFVPTGIGGDSGVGTEAYAIFQEGGGWGFPYPDLRIAYHVGIKFGANPSYQGMRFYTDYDMSSMIFQVNGGSSYLYKYVWMYTGDSTQGIYTGYNSAHFYPNGSSSYTPWRADGQRSGWYGYGIGTGNNPHVMFDGSGNGGMYVEGYGRWLLYHSLGNNCMGVGTSATSGGYGMYVNRGIYATEDIVAYSDRRKKKNIITIDNALSKVLDLRGVYYNRIDKLLYNPDKRFVGVIAQEVVEVLPEVVTYAHDIDEYGVAYGNFAGLFIEAIKEQNEIIKKQADEIAEMKEILNKLIFNNKK